MISWPGERFPQSKQVQKIWFLMITGSVEAIDIYVITRYKWLHWQCMHSSSQTDETAAMIEWVPLLKHTSNEHFESSLLYSVLFEWLP